MSPARLVRQLRTGQVTWTSDEVDVRRPFPLALAVVGLAALGLGLLASGFVAVAGAVVLAIGILGFVGLRVAADTHGLTVRNWLTRRTFPWRDVAEVRVGVVRFKGTCIEIALKDGRVATPGATRELRLAYSHDELERIARRLGALRRAHVLEDPERP